MCKHLRAGRIKPDFKVFFKFYIDADIIKVTPNIQYSRFILLIKS